MYYHSFYTADPFKPKSIEFDVWSEAQIKKLSVARIHTHVPFDALGYPVVGGLYDNRLGPLKFNSDPCATCGNLLMKCSGHYGHIELPFPVFNPLFIAIVANILRASCLQCHTFLMSEAEKCVRMFQLKLIDEGYLIEAHQLEEYLLECLTKPLPDIINEMVIYCAKKITSTSTGPCKYADDAWRFYISKIFRQASATKVCVYCKKKSNKVKYQNGRLFTDGKTKTYFMPIAARDHLRSLWLNEKDLLKTLVKVLDNRTEEFPTDICFTSSVLVTPSSTRPVNIVNQKPVEHPKNVMYRLVLQDCLQIRGILQVMNEAKTKEPVSQEVKDMVNAQRGENINEKLHNAWHSLQVSVNSLLDANALKSYINTSVGTTKIGLKQLIEKKSGIIRKNMMGKRVDFFARSVVTPDPILDINEIGIPEAFAKKLTFPVPVASWNVTELRKLVLNGPQNYPGANIVETDDGSVVWISGTNTASREGLAKTLLTPRVDSSGPKIVHRHLRDGDMLLINRQPSLHKPSIMAHKARVLKDEKTFRLHYANCKAYNADFDGDEINAHFPQSELARAEASEIVNAENQYLVPRDGTPLSGLIQDHVIAAFRLTSRDKFYNRLQYHQFVFQAIGFVIKDIKTLAPCILKPRRLWTGKQVISTIIINLTPEGEVPLNLLSKTKLSFNSWPQSSVHCEYLSMEERKFMSDTNFIVRKGELLSGLLDKNHVGSTHFGLIHSFYELYGGKYSANLLSAFSKLFTYYQQKHGFTLGVLDILVKKRADCKRSKIAVKSQKLGLTAAKKALNIPEEENVEEEQVQRMLEVSYKKNLNFRDLIDREYKTLLDQITNEINKTCLPLGLLQPFPDNNLQLMVQSGAKGSTVNAMQISCLLGQIELEGKRPPLMISGKSLPTFRPYDLNPVAGGFISSRFMTGIKPQEFFFHCMAGREGLIDTAVKTSRSGYLQRCLVKHLEGLVVHYDLTVRDSDSSVIQFLYGEDGLDILKSQLLMPDQMKFFNDNIDTFQKKKEMRRFKKGTTELVALRKKEIGEFPKVQGSNRKCTRDSGFLKFCREVGPEKMVIKKQEKIPGRSSEATTLCQMWERTVHKEMKKSYTCMKRPDPVMANFKPDTHFGSVSEVMENMIEDFVTKNENNELFKSSRFKDVVYWKSFNSLCQPGEAVGVLAAQSVGEPSTQMTLNTFHFAGRGEMNVTLGIPRLREIIMVASKRIKTPCMEIPFKTNVHKLEKKAEALRKSLTRVVLKDVLENISVKESLKLKKERVRTYELLLRYLPRKAYRDSTNIKPQQIIKYVGTSFVAKLDSMMKKALKCNYSEDLVLGDTATRGKKFKNTYKDNEDEPHVNENTDPNMAVSDESDEDSDIGADGDGDATEEKLRNQRGELEYGDENTDDDSDEIHNENDSDSEDDKLEKLTNSGNQDTNNYEESDNSSISKTITESNFNPSVTRGTHVSKKYGIKSLIHDDKHMSWSKIVLWASLSYKRLDLSNLLPFVVETAMIHEVPGIKRAITYMNNEGFLTLKTEGSYGIAELFKHDHILDLNKLYSNDVHAVAQTYGIEAANRVIVEEIQQVFNVYGITVDPRHLLLIADYMTFDGSYQPLNRTGMDNCPSPFQQMTFESTLKYLKNATIRKLKDNLQSPSSSLIVGKESKIGSGLMSLYCK